MTPFDGSEQACLRPSMSPAGIGVALAVANVFVIAIGMAATFGPADVVGVATTVSLIGMIPGVLTGALLGWVAGELRAQARWLRLAVLLSPALLVVCALAGMFGLVEFAAVSFIPTIVATLLLERFTRARVEPAVPLARAR